MKGIRFLLSCAWRLTKICLSWVSYKACHIINIINLYCSNVGYGKNLKTFGLILLDIHPKSRLIIGNNVQLISDKRRYGTSLYSPVKIKTYSSSSEVIIEDNVGLNGTNITSRSCRIVIGEKTVIAGNCTIMDSDFHNLWPPEERLSFSGEQSDKDVTIGKNVWIGLGSIILKGVSIGDNSVIAAGSVVVNAIPSNSLAGGNPAQIISILG